MPVRDMPEPEGALAERMTKHGHRRLKLNQIERKDFKQSETIDRLVLMILSLEDNMTYEEMAEELEITVPALKNLTRTEEFQDRYNDHFMTLGQDPRVEVTQSRIVELLPRVFMQMQEALVNPDVPWTAKWNIMSKILELSGIEKPQNIRNDRKEIEKFLSSKNEGDSIQITIPGKYMDAMHKYREGEHLDKVEEEIIEGDYQSDVGLDE